MPGIVLAAFAALLDLLAVTMGWHPVRVVTKPLPALLLALVAWRSGRSGTRILAGGLVLAALGDELLLGSGDTAFLLGMLAFAAVQVTYVAAYAVAGVFKRRASVAQYLLGAGYNCLLFVFALPPVAARAGDFALPLRAYALALLAMASLAAQMRFATALGAAIFVLSDLTLAYGKFYPRFPLSGDQTELVVMGTYFLAQLLITLGMTYAPFENARNDQALAQEGARHV